MKKILALLSVITLAIMMTGCGQVSNNDAGTSVSKAASNNLLFNVTENRWYSATTGATANYVGQAACLICHLTIGEEFQKSGTLSSATITANLHYSQGTSHTQSPCGECHSTGWNQVSGVSAASPTTNATSGVNLQRAQCESCHGPGSLHITGSGTAKKSLINRIANAKSSCYRCHFGYKEQVTSLEVATASVTDLDLRAAQVDGVRSLRSARMNQARMLKGELGYEYSGETYTSTGHDLSISNSCVVCHMQYNNTSPRTQKARHDSQEVNSGVCASCHNSSIKESAQDEIKALMVQLGGTVSSTNLLPSSRGYNGTNGLIVEWASANSIIAASANTAATDDPAIVKLKRAVYNYCYVAYDKSFGIHNFAYAKKLLQDAISELTIP